MRPRVFLLLLGVSFVLNLFFISKNINYPYQLDYEEGFLRHTVFRQNRGEQIYYDNTQPPYNFVPYPPVYLIINIFLGRVLGFSFLIGRLVSPISLFIIGLVLYRTSLVFIPDKTSSLFASFLFLTSGIVLMWSSLYRVDMLGLMFSASGLYFIWLTARIGYF